MQNDCIYDFILDPVQAGGSGADPWPLAPAATGYADPWEGATSIDPDW